MRQFLFLRIFASVLALGIASPLGAQTTFGAITGTVRDSTGGVLPGVTLEATHVGSNYRYAAQSNARGQYTLPQLREGEYAVRASLSGFQEFVAKGVLLSARDERRIDIALQVGALETKVEVTTGATLIETDTPRIGDSKDADQLKSLPLNTRSLYSFLALSPGVVSAGGGEAFRRFAGSRRNQSDQSIDGVSVSTGQDGTQITPLVQFIESFQEVRVDMANNSADMGSVGQVTLVSKSGSNELHGSLFDYYSTPFFRARNPFAAQRPAGIRHNPGGSIGGPIVLPKLYNGRDKSFFFFSFETARGSKVLQLINPTVPLEAWRRGDFSALATPIRNPFAGGQPFPGNRIPDNLINPVARKIQERFWPLPTSGSATALTANNYREQLTRAFDPNTYWTARLDHRFSEKAFVFGRYTWNRSYNRAFEGNLPTIGQLDRVRDTRATTVAFTYTVSSNLVSETRWGLSFSDDPRQGPLRGREIVDFLGLRGLVSDLPDINGVPNIAFQGLGVTSITQTAVRRPGFRNFTNQWQQHLNWFKGRHSLKAGAQLGRYESSDGQQSNNLFGNVSFSNRFTGHPYADFLLGIPTTTSRAAAGLLIDRVRWGYDLFVTDDFRITRKLTLNIGLRYELHPYWTEANGLLSTFDVDSGRIVVPNGSLSRVSPLLPRGYVTVVEAKDAGYPGDTLIKTDINNFAPRMGFAFRPWDNKTVIRGGFGIFYDAVTRPGSAGGSPYVINEPGFTNPANSPTVILPQVFPTAGTGGPTTVGLPQAFKKDLRVPYSMQYSLTLEHERWNTGFRLSYIGTNTRQGDYTFNINQPLPDARPYVQKPRLYPNYPAISYRTNGAGHQYHSLTTEIERRFKNGLAYQASWVWARDIGDLNGFLEESPENAYDRRRERGVALDIPTHRLTGNVIYELPFGREKMKGLLGGWQLSMVGSLYTGQFLTPLWTGPDPTGTAFTSSTTPATVTIRPDILRDPNLPSSERTVQRWFDVTAFAPPAAGRYGTSSKGVIKGPGSTVFHAGLAKRVSLGERTRLRLELTATNLFNHPNYANPALNISNAATIGVISNVGVDSDLDQAGARSFRVGARLEW